MVWYILLAIVAFIILTLIDHILAKSFILLLSKRDTPTENIIGIAFVLPL